MELEGEFENVCACGMVACSCTVLSILRIQLFFFPSCRVHHTYLQIIAREVVNPDLIDVTLEDIGGLDDIIDDLV